MNKDPYAGFGLQVNGSGEITLGGKIFYGYGVNFHPAVSITLDREFGFYNSPDPEEYVKALADYGIPCMRVMFGVFYPDAVGLYANEDTREKYLSSLEKLVITCEKHRVGIIASLFWQVTAFNDYCMEPLSAVTDPQSKTIALQKQYIKDVVGRFRRSKAIWAWEIGNELNLACEICTYKDEKGIERLVTTEMLVKYYTLIGDLIRAEDPYRMITGGDAAPRKCSMAMLKTVGSDTSTVNSRDDYKKIMDIYTPGEIDTFSVHYPEIENIGMYAELARELKKGFYVGECYSNKRFDNPCDKLSPEESPEEAAERESWFEMLDTCAENGVQLLTYWTYGSYSQAGAIDVDSVELGAAGGIKQNVYVAESLRKVNNRFRKEGKTDTEGYWKSAAGKM